MWEEVTGKGRWKMAETGNKGIKAVREFFGMSLAEMKTEWVPLPPKDKAEILAGIEDGTLTY